MKNVILSILVLALSVTTANAQWWSTSKKVKGNGEFTSETRKVSDYNEISVEGSLNVALVAGKEGVLEVEGESNLLEHIITEVNRGKLKIYVENRVNLRPTDDYEIIVTVPFEDLERVALTGSGDVYGTDVIKAQSFKIDLTGSGDISLHLEAQTVKGQVTGSGDINLNGKTQHLDCEVTGSGDFDASDLTAATVNANVSGSGDIEVYAYESLKSRVSGSGDINYKGNPKKQDFSTFGSGTISGN